MTAERDLYYEFMPMTRKRKGLSVVGLLNGYFKASSLIIILAVLFMLAVGFLG